MGDHYQLASWLTSKGVADNALSRACFQAGMDSGWAEQEAASRRAKYPDVHSHSADHEAGIQRGVRAWSREFRLTSYTVQFWHGEVKRRVIPYDGRRYDQYVDKTRGKGKSHFAPSIFGHNGQRHYLPPYPIEWAKTIIVQHCGEQVWDELGWNRESYHPADFWNVFLSEKRIPLRLEEGVRKAVCASIEIPTTPCIGLGGINQWKVVDEGLTALLAAFIKGRELTQVVFDHGESASIQARSLAAQILKEGGVYAEFGTWGEGTKSTDERLETVQRIQGSGLIGTQVAEWMMDIGHLPDMRHPWGDTSYRRMKRKPDIVLGKHERLCLETVGKYFNDDERIVCLIDANIGSGKTELIAELIASRKRWKLVEVALSRAALCVSVAEKFQIATPSSEVGSRLRAGYFDNASHHGCAQCGESAWREVSDGIGGQVRNLKWIADRIRSGEWTEKDGRVLLILDEVATTLPNWLRGGVNQRVSSSALHGLETLLASPFVDVIGGDALLGDAEIEFVEETTGVRPTVIQARSGWPKNVYVMQNRQAYKELRAYMIHKASRGDLGLLHLSVLSKEESWKLGLLASFQGRPIVINSEINRVERLIENGSIQADPYVLEFMRFQVQLNREFHEDPDGTIEKYGLTHIISTSSLTQGVSIKRHEAELSMGETGSFSDAETELQSRGRTRLAKNIVTYVGNCNPAMFPPRGLSGDEVDEAENMLGDAHSDLLKDLPAGFATYKIRWEHRARMERSTAMLPVVMRSFYAKQGYTVFTDTSLPQDLPQLKVQTGKIDQTQTKEEDPDFAQLAAMFKEKYSVLLLLGEVTLDQVREEIGKVGFNLANMEAASPLLLFSTLEEWGIGLQRYLAGMEAQPDYRIKKGDEQLTQFNDLLVDLFDEMDKEDQQRFLSRTGLKRAWKKGKQSSLKSIERLFTTLGIPFKKKTLHGEGFLQINWRRIQEVRA